jgi:hypothetical protein
MAHENHFDRAAESKPAPFTKTVKGAAPDAPEERLSRRVGGGCRAKARRLHKLGYSDTVLRLGRAGSSSSTRQNWGYCAPADWLGVTRRYKLGLWDGFWLV